MSLANFSVPQKNTSSRLRRHCLTGILPGRFWCRKHFHRTTYFQHRNLLEGSMKRKSPTKRRRFLCSNFSSRFLAYIFIEYFFRFPKFSPLHKFHFILNPFFPFWHLQEPTDGLKHVSGAWPTRSWGNLGIWSHGDWVSSLSLQQATPSLSPSFLVGNRKTLYDRS